MRVARTVLGGLVFLLTGGALCTDALSATAGRADNWERVKLAVARNSVLIRVVHIKGDLTSVLHIGTHAEVVIGGSVTGSGRIEAEGIAAIHVQGDMNGVIERRRIGNPRTGWTQERLRCDHGSRSSGAVRQRCRIVVR